MRTTLQALFLILSWLIFHSVQCFDLPGLQSELFCASPSKNNSKCKTQIDVFVNRLNSVESVFPYEYSYFNFCSVANKSSPAENLGQILFGERIRSSPYAFQFPKDETCNLVCKRTYSSTDPHQKKFLVRLLEGILLNYQQHWIIDNIPVTICQMDSHEQEVCSRGFPIGCYIKKYGTPPALCHVPNPIEETFYVFNHLNFEISYHNGEGETWSDLSASEIGRIISAKVSVFSISSDNCNRSAPPLSFNLKTEHIEIPFTYSVDFKQNNQIRWASRWDYILKSSPDTKIQWLSIINSLIVILLLSGFIAVILLRILHRDIARYNRVILDEEDEEEEAGWKLIHGDVFRAPKFPMLLCVFVGNGIQISTMSLITIVFACLGFLSQERRGALMTSMIVFYVLLGTPAGYTTARLYKMFAGKDPKKCILMTSIACPGVFFMVFFILNFIFWIHGSSAAVPFTAFVTLLALWFLVSTPLVFLGAFFGFNHSVIENSVRTNHIIRPIPDQPCYMNFGVAVMIAGTISFGCIYTQLSFILSSIWAHEYYYFFGFLLIIFFIMIIICSEMTILSCYLQLCFENHQWWWRSFFVSGSAAVYFFLYCVFYFSMHLEITGAISALLYFGYTLLLTFLLFLVTGTIGFLSCFYFVRKIYSAIKVD